MPSVSIKGRIALVTGASSGIGQATAEGLAAEGARLILAARRIERLEELAARLKTAHATPTLLIQLDVRDRAAVEAKLAHLPAEWADVDILVNNAGLSRGLNPLHEGLIDDWDEMIDTNVKGLLYVTRAILPGMVERQRGHVIHVGSVAGRDPYAGGAVYSGTKAAVAIISRAMKIDVLERGIRVTNIEPGLVETEFSLVRFHGDAERAKKPYIGLQPLTPEDVADAIVWAVTRPAHVNVQDMLLLATAQATATTAYRKS
ncbi:MAG: SDR family NAD(P)-dependent oxidoreductase [Anaerolineae bacterium]|jgi:serine 3-dehydrogenase|nr:SDR family NAD(P)-dependent oxidoreductase [Anaerolineae bacterium]